MINKNKVIAGVTALAVVLSSGVIAFAASDTEAAPTGKERQSIMSSLTDEQREALSQARTESMQAAIDALVDSDVITQDDADKLTEFNRNVKGDRVSCTLTEEQLAALHEESQTIFETLISDLVDDGTLTQDQADQMEPGKRMMRGLDLTEAQRDAVMQARANAVEQAAANLTEKGTITQEEADSITEMPKIKAATAEAVPILTDEQKTALGDSVKANMQDKLAELVIDGTLTQDQADHLLDGAGMLRMGPGGKPDHVAGGPLSFSGACTKRL